MTFPTYTDKTIAIVIDSWYTPEVAFKMFPIPKICCTEKIVEFQVQKT